MRKLLEVTRLSPADQTDARLLLDKADQIATMIKKDGSWGMHAQNYLLDQVKTAQAYLAQSPADHGQGRLQQDSNKIKESGRAPLGCSSEPR